jgi:hypothetical protein
MPTFLNVRYEEKEEAKRLGARWDSIAKQWYVPDGIAIEPFSKWLPNAQVLPSRVKGSCRHGFRLTASELS